MEEIGTRVSKNKGIKSLKKLHKSSNCCCFCLTAKTGAYIIGIGLLINLLAELSHGLAIRAILKVVALIPFLMMVFNDTAYSRQLYLFGFCVTQPLIAAVNLCYYQNILVDSVAFGDLFCWFSKKWISTMGGDKEFEESQNECNDADEDEQQDCEANLDQCPALPGGAFKVLFVITPIVLVMNVHFAFVLFTHYKNSRLQESMGGCADENGPEYEDQVDDE